jgi:hypothetical protein
VTPPAPVDQTDSPDPNISIKETGPAPVVPRDEQKDF